MKKLKDKFTFKKEGHKYQLNGVDMTGVTTVLSVIAKPSLIQWAANMAVDYIEAHDPQMGVSAEVLKEARSAHRKKKEEAGQKGTDIHAVIEEVIKHAIEYTKGVIYPTEITKAIKTNPQVAHFISWAIGNRVKFLASEEKVYSKNLFIAGTIDFICEIHGEVWIGDLKTGSGIYPEHFFQTAAYQKLMEDMVLEGSGGMPVNVKGHVIVNCKKDGSFEEKRSISNQDSLDAFLGALKIYRVQEKLKGNII